MPQAPNKLEPIVTRDLASAAQTVIDHVRRETSYPFLLDAKLGDADSPPGTDQELASAHGTPSSTISYRWTLIAAAIAHADGAHGNPLGQIAQRANNVMAAAAIINRHRRHPPVYSDDTIRTFAKLDLAAPQQSPIIRAAGHVSPPPVVQLNHDVDFVIGDIAGHMARSSEPQAPKQILQALRHRQQELNRWPQFDITLFILRVADISPDCAGCYHADQPWGTFLSVSQLVTNTMLRILNREQRPLATKCLASETAHLVGRFLPDGHNTTRAIRAAARASNEVSWQGMGTLGLRNWATAPDPHDSATRPGRTGNLAYAFLTQHGTADVAEVIEHVQRNSPAKRRTVQQAINHDPANRFIRISENRVAKNPIPAGHNPGSPSLIVVPDERECKPPPVLRESELLWLTHYMQALNDLTPPLPSCVAITGARAAGLAHEGDTLEITVVVDTRHRLSLEPRLASIAAATSGLVPSIRPNIILLSPQQWEHQQDGESPEAHHNAWLATNTAP